jgi:hypothetical protein
MCRLLSPYEGVQRGLLILEEDHVEDAVLPTLEEDEISGFNRRRDMSDSQIVAGHVMYANGKSEHV